MKERVCSMCNNAVFGYWTFGKVQYQKIFEKYVCDDCYEKTEKVRLVKW